MAPGFPTLGPLETGSGWTDKFPSAQLKQCTRTHNSWLHLACIASRPVTAKRASLTISCVLYRLLSG